MAAESLEQRRQQLFSQIGRALVVQGVDEPLQRAFAVLETFFRIHVVLLLWRDPAEPAFQVDVLWVDAAYRDVLHRLLRAVQSQPARIPIRSDDLGERLLRATRPLYFPNVCAELTWSRPHIETEGPITALVVPFRLIERPALLCFCAFRMEDAFSASDRALLEDLVPVFAKFLELRYLQRQLQQQVAIRTRELELLYRVFRRAELVYDVRDFLKSLLVELPRVVPFDLGTIVLIEDHRWEAIVYTRRPVVEPCLREILQESLQMILEGETVTRFPAHRIERIPGGNIDAPPVEHTRTRVFFPLSRHPNARPIAVLCLAAEAEHAVDEHHLRLVNTVVSEIAAVVRRLRESIEREQAQFSELVSVLPVGIVVIDPDGHIHIRNPSASDALRVLAPQALETGQITHLGDTPLARVLEPPPNRMCHEIEWTNGAARVFEVRSRAIRLPDGPGYVLIIEDVTQERAIRRRAEEQDRLAAVGQLAAGIAHDFNNLLTTMIGYAEVVQLRTRDSGIRDAMRIIVQQGQRAAGLIRQILDFARQTTPEKQPMELGVFLKEFAKLLQRTIPENISIQLDIEPGEYWLEADPTQMQQILLNIAVNARDAMPEGGVLTLRLRTVTRQAREWICVEIADTGTGIPAEILPRIFEPFFTTKPRGQGTGLGLAQVYGLVKQHDGDIEVRSQVGVGTTFFLYFPPLPPARRPQAYEGMHELFRAEGWTVLLVEDDAVVLDVIRRHLEYLGCTVLATTRPLHAVEIFRSRAQDIDLVLSDLTMPELSGLELFRTLQEIRPDVRFAVITGYAVPHEVRSLRAHGLVGWVQKPVNLQKLSDLLRRVAEHRA